MSAPNPSLRNPAIEQLNVLVGQWKLTLSNAWFLESAETEIHGSASVEWLGEAFIVMRAELGGNPTWDFVFGHSDPQDAYTALYHDERGVARVFDMTFSDGQWTMSREDPDMHQRFAGEVTGDRIAGHWDASDDAGETWRKDFDLVFERA